MRVLAGFKFLKMQLNIFEEHNKTQLLTDLFQAYYDARSNKRNTISALDFEMHYEHNLFELHREISEGVYKIRPEICFINFKPVKREIFAAHFRDRVVHHLVYNYIASVFEKIFINDSYSCRKGKGTHYGIKRLGHFIRSCSENYKKDCYILKLDIKGYFMSIDRHLLYEKTIRTLNQFKHKIDFDLPLVMGLLEKIIFNDPTKNYILKGRIVDWQGLPSSKSLFYSGEGKGLPIGNLTSQLFSNVYLNEFDHFVKKDLGIKYYGRYVDDFFLIHPDQDYLKQIIPMIDDYLKSKLFVSLHPNKIYLQHFSKGVQFLGAVIKPYRNYASSRTKGNFYNAVYDWNGIIQKQNRLKKKQTQKFISTMNSYLGMMNHYNARKLQNKMLYQKLANRFWLYVVLAANKQAPLFADCNTNYKKGFKLKRANKQQYEYE